jgi:hypothetical protein
MFERGCVGHGDAAPLGSFGWYNENVEGMLGCDELSSGEEKPDRGWAGIMRAWGAAVLRPYMDVSN